MGDDNKKVIRKTRSLCPICLRNISADLVEYESKKIYMEKSCPVHGFYKDLIWRGLIDFADWREESEPLQEGEGINCPSDCGICKNHNSQTCCVVLDVTHNCNLMCNFCFAEGKPLSKPKNELTLEELKEKIDYIFSKTEATIQLSGGEPTLRDDLPLLIKYIKKKGGKYVQLNSNGIRLATDEVYVKALSDAGLDYVFLQFDGVSDTVFDRLRGKPLLGIKENAIKLCGKYGIGTTLVPTVVRGINDDQIGDIIRYGISMSPYVRGIHFQPVSYFGRFPKHPSEEERYTLDELIIDVSTALDVCYCSFHPSRCDHPGCGFHASFIIEENRLVSMTTEQSCCCSVSSAKQNREYIGLRWSALKLKREETSEKGSFDEFLNEYALKGFTITAMAFQDAGNIDIERLKRCSLHTLKEDKLVPFCAKYLNSWGD